MALIDEIVPKGSAPAASAPSPTPAPAPEAAPAPESDADPVIPDEVLRIPAFGALLQGAPPAVRVPVGVESPEVEVITRNRDALVNAGFGIYRTKDNSEGVFFNTQFISPEEIQLADQKGKLDEIAPPIDELKNFFDAELSKEGAAPAPGGPATPPTAAPATSMTPPAAPQAQKAIANSRLKNVALGAPTSGPAPGGGRLLNSILKPTV